VLQIETEIEILSSDTLAIDELRGDAEECVDELALTDYVAFGQPPNLTLPDQVHRLIPFDRPARPSVDRKPRLATIRFLMKRWSCSMMLFK
jgi:hypothetical protein